MSKLIINLELDYTIVEKSLKGFPLRMYKTTIEKFIFKGLIVNLTHIALKNYSPVYTDKKATFTEENEDIVYLKEEKLKLDNFFLGNFRELLNKPEVSKAMSNRYVGRYYKIISTKLGESMKGTIIGFLTAMSIKTDYYIDTLNHKVVTK